jgi:hypothetical protein
MSRQWFFACWYNHLPPKNIFFSKVKNLLFTAPYSNSFFLLKISNLIFLKSDVETTSFLDMLKLEKTVCFESADWNSNIWVYRPFLCQLKFFQLLINSSPREIPQDASQREGNQSLQNKSTDKALKSNFQVESSPIKQKIFKTTHVRKRYIIEKSLNCRMKYSKYSFLLQR